MVVGVFCCLLPWHWMLCPPQSRPHSCFAYVNGKPVQTLLLIFILTPDRGFHINANVWEELTLYRILFCSWGSVIPVYWGLSPQQPLARSQDVLASSGIGYLPSEQWYTVWAPSAPSPSPISRLYPGLFSAQMYHLAAWVWASHYLCHASVTSL